MSRWLALAMAGAIAGALGAIVATVWVGSAVREDTIVAKPYEEGLRQDAERSARAALGLAAALADPAPEAGATPLAFTLADRRGAVEDARVTVELSRPETGRGGVAAEARALGGGRYAAALAFPAPGPWDVRYDVVRGADRVRLEQRVVARRPCDLGAGPCTRPLEGGGEVTLEIGPRPIRTMQDLTVRATWRDPYRPGVVPVSEVHGVEVSVSFSMPGMEMGENRVALDTMPIDGGDWIEGKAVLVRCPSGKRDWIAEVSIGVGREAPRTARFPFRVEE